MRKTEDMKIKFLGIIPWYKNKNLELSPQEVAAFSGLLTFRGDSVEDLIKEAQEKGQDISKKVKFILRKSSLKGHASMATMPVFCFTFEGSKMVGSMMTGIMYSSALMHSGRRADVGRDHNVYPKSILENEEALKLYKDAAFNNIDTFNKLLELGIIKDESGKILHYGTYGTGIITLPAESLATFAREVENESSWMPEEGKIIVKKMQSELKALGIDLLYATRSVAPKNTLPYPNLFKDPAKNNFVRDIAEDRDLEDTELKVIGVDSYLGKGFERRVKEVKDYQDKLFADKELLKREWKELLNLKRNLIRDYQNAFSLKTYSNVSWRVWRDKKRHRTASVTTESIYYGLEQALKITNKFKDEFNSKRVISDEAIEAIDKVFAIPLKLRKNPEALEKYLDCTFSSMGTYEKLLGMGVKPSDAVFIIPRAFRIKMIQEYNLYNIMDGYYPLRSCPTADEQILRQTRDEIKQLTEILDEKELSFMNWLVGPKCMGPGFCPEEKTCGYIKKHVKDYDDDFHEEMKENLEELFLQKMDEIN
ncbi:MAG: FAD-dependent thymidylate synthase [Desulfobacterales bacterium]|nr:FAD-dependent thymidylate synthase [Desulfobacterales bacterium]MCP4159401.1 FAD-dependent thymidylate synthase [Deltaproteobacteria bacterium]